VAADPAMDPTAHAESNLYPAGLEPFQGAELIRSNIRRRGFPDPGITSDAVLFGDCLILEGVK
jgi:hypothetical protein